MTLLMIISIMAWASTSHHQGRRLARSYLDQLTSIRLGKEFNDTNVILLSSSSLSVVGSSSLELHSFKGNNVLVVCNRAHAEVATGSDGLGLGSVLRALITFGGMLNQLDFLLAVGDSSRDTKEETLHVVHGTVVILYKNVRLVHRVVMVESMNREHTTDLKVIASVTGPVIVSQKEATIHLRLHTNR